jgi:hypothetical protein
VTKEEMKLSRHNYSKYSNNKQHSESDIDLGLTVDAAETVNTETYKAAPEVVVVEETVETVTLPETVEGVVVNCAKLNVRAEPNPTADVVAILDVTSEIEININKSTNDFFSVCTATGVEGYCMRKFVDARL